jgi:Phosphodiester glycosidase
VLAAARLKQRRRLGLIVVSAALVAAGTTFYVTTSRGSANAAISPNDEITVTTMPEESPQIGWTVVGRGTSGVYSDKKQVTVDGITFLAARFRKATTKLSWHPGSEDPPNPHHLLAGLTNKIDFTGEEGLNGVLGAFNGAFKLSSQAGGLKVGSTVLAPFKPGFATIAIDAGGQVAMWAGAAYQAPVGFNGVVFRQNLQFLVEGGEVTTPAKNPSESLWGATVGPVVRQSRTGVGLDALGNLVYVATMGKCLPSELAQAMVQAGLVKGMELDINPYWPILGMAPTPIHKPLGGFTVILPGSQHSPHVFIEGWTRDFFVVTARR